MKPETILIVDDEELIRWTLIKELAREGYNLLEAEDVASALSKIENEAPDLMLLDQKLPDGTGIKLLESLKERSLYLPAIMLTGLDKSEIAVKALKLGAYDYITKPIDLITIKTMIPVTLSSTPPSTLLLRSLLAV